MFYWNAVNLPIDIFEDNYNILRDRFETFSKRDEK